MGSVGKVEKGGKGGNGREKQGEEIKYGMGESS